MQLNEFQMRMNKTDDLNEKKFLRLKKDMNPINFKIGQQTEQVEKLKEQFRSLQHDINIRDLKIQELEKLILNFQMNFRIEMLDTISKKTEVINTEIRPLLEKVQRETTQCTMRANEHTIKVGSLQSEMVGMNTAMTEIKYELEMLKNFKMQTLENQTNNCINSMTELQNNLNNFGNILSDSMANS